jgi:hypothetical protein
VALELAQEHAQDLEAVLGESDDTAHHDDYGRYRKILLGEGFCLRHFGFPGVERREERWFHGDGIEAVLRVARRPARDAEYVDRAILRYNWVPVIDDPGWRIHGSGQTRLLEAYGVRNVIYVSSLDVRLAFQFKVARLRALGRFLWPWCGDPPQ